MKVYRAVPDIFVTNNKLKNENIKSLESIYYENGYTSFIKGNISSDYNNYKENIVKEGKFFYLFSEDAIYEASILMSTCHKLRMYTCLVLEYDIPDEYIFKIIGYGDYTNGIIKKYLIETYIEKDLFGKDEVNSNELDIESKRKMIINSFKESLKRMVDVKSIYDMLDYATLFKSRDFAKIIEDEELLNEVLINTPLYNYFMESERMLIKSPYITKKVLPINTNYWSFKFNGFDEIGSYYKDMGIDCDFHTKEDSKKKIIEYLMDEDYDKEEVKKLILDIKK